MIPKIIWQTHESNYEDLLPFQKDTINTWKNLNPQWEHRYVGSQERSTMVKNYSNFLYSYYLESSNQRQSDIWRLIAVYNNGGFYADMDSICIETIEDAIGKNYKGEDVICSPIGFQNSGINNSNFGAIKNSKTIKSIIDSLVLEYKNIELTKVKSLRPGDPENTIFSLIAQENKDLICFNKDYFLHSSGYKSLFNSNIMITFNKEKINYHKLCINMNWPIYYI